MGGGLFLRSAGSEGWKGGMNVEEQIEWQEENQLIQGRIPRVLLTFAGPYLVAILLQSLYGAADLFVVGRYTGSAAVSAVSIGSQMMSAVVSIFLGFSMGGTVLVGQCVGAGDGSGAAKAIGTMGVAFSGLALLFTPVMLLLVNPLTAAMQTPVQAVEATHQYLFLCCCGIPFIIGYNVVSGIFRGLGDSRTPVYFIALACGVNVGLDFLLVGGFGLGAAGAAIATVAAQGLSFLASLWYMARKGFAFPFHRSHLRLDRRSLKFIFQLGLPLALQNVLVNLSFLIITAIVNAMGLIASAAVGVVEKLINFAMLPASAFASAVAPITAQNIGAGKPERALQGLRWGIGYSLAFGIAVCIVSQIWPQALAGIFSADPAVIVQAADYLRSYSMDCVLVSFVFPLNSYFSGCGRSIITAAHNLTATFLVRIPVSYLLSRRAGVTLFQIGLAAPAASLLSVLICGVYFYFQRRRVSEAGKI